MAATLAQFPPPSLPLREKMRVQESSVDDVGSSSLEKLSLPEDRTLDAGYYIHKKPLGEGGFGKVKLATHLKTNQKVAIKMMNKKKLGADLQRVRIEIDALKILQHENIAKLLQVVEDETDIYLVLEYCAGGELFDYLIAKRRLAESEVRVIMNDLFRVLAFIHSKGFAHRDLKPENILFDNKHRIKLIDFGLAANSSQNKAALAFLQTCCGSPAYAAPELLKGKTYSGPAVDVWSAGVLLYSLLVGQLPFEDDNMHNLYKKIQIGNYTTPPFLSEDVRHLIKNMLQIVPENRFTVPEVLNHRWMKRGQSPLAPPTESISMEPEFDSDAFDCCKLLFPTIKEEVLRAKINDFGYHTSTYLLLKNNPEAIKTVRGLNQARMRVLAEQRQRITTPNVANIKRKLNLDAVVGDSSTPLAKRPRETPIPTPTQRPLPITPRLVTNQVNPMTLNGTPNVNTKIMANRTQVLSTKQSYSPYGTPIRATPGRLTDKTARRIVSPKMKVNCENRVPPGVKPQTPTKIPTMVKSPLRPVNQVVMPQSPQIMTTPVKGQTPVKTPLGVKASSKKSLLKRIMASATPAKSNEPRKLNSADPSNNITMTSFQDPQECIDKLAQSLRSKGVECKQSNFSLKCFYSDKVHSALKFDLEICRFNGLCVIHRKRLKGDAWNYKKVCELILHVSNEQQLAALQSAPVTTTSL